MVYAIKGKFIKPCWNFSFALVCSENAGNEILSWNAVGISHNVHDFTLSMDRKLALLQFHESHTLAWRFQLNRFLLAPTYVKVTGGR